MMRAAHSLLVLLEEDSGHPLFSASLPSFLLASPLIAHSSARCTRPWALCLIIAALSLSPCSKSYNTSCTVQVRFCFGGLLPPLFFFFETVTVNSVKEGTLQSRVDIVNCKVDSVRVLFRSGFSSGCHFSWSLSLLGGFKSVHHRQQSLLFIFLLLSVILVVILADVRSSCRRGVDLLCSELAPQVRLCTHISTGLAVTVIASAFSISAADRSLLLLRIAPALLDFDHGLAPSFLAFGRAPLAPISPFASFALPCF